MGVFHTCCNLMIIIGKCFQDAGLRNLAVESEGSVDKVLLGKKSNRELRFLKLTYEALLCLAWTGLYPWLDEHHMEQLSQLSDSVNYTKTFLYRTRNMSTTAQLLRLSSDY